LTDKIAVNEVYRVIVGKPGHPDMLPYIDCWQDTILSQPAWLRPYLEETCRIMVARVAITSKCREKTKELVLVEEPKETLSPYVPLYPPLPPAPSSTPLPLTSDGEAQGAVTSVKSDPEISGASIPLTSPSPMDPIPTLSLPVLTPHLPFNQRHPTSLHEDPSLLQIPTALQMPLREVRGLVYYDQQGQIQQRMDIHLPALYHHRPPKMEASYSLLHGKTLSSD
jgi:hypothetical protein